MELWTIPNIKDEKCFNPKFLFFVCVTMCFYSKWYIKKKKNTKIQPKKIVHETVNFGSTKID